MYVQKQKVFNSQKGYAVVRFPDNRDALSFAVDVIQKDGVHSSAPSEVDDEFFSLHEVRVRLEPNSKTEHQKMVSFAEKIAKKYKAVLFRSFNS